MLNSVPLVDAAAGGYSSYGTIREIITIFVLK